MSVTNRQTFKVHFKKSKQGKLQINEGGAPRITERTGRSQRITKLMALAIRFDSLIRSGEVTDQAELAQLGHVSRARITQIMNLLQLAPDIQEELLFLPPTIRGLDIVRDHDLREIAVVLSWEKQRRLWRELKEKCGLDSAQSA